MKIIAIDPSGDFTENKKGHTGFALYNGTNISLFQINADNYFIKTHYWNAVLNVIEKEKPDWVICEDFKLLPSKGRAQSHQQLQTPELIGQIEMLCLNRNIKFVRQQSSFRKRYSGVMKVSFVSKLLRIKNINKPQSQHEKDALGHMLWFLLHNKKFPDRLDKITLIPL